MDNNCVSIFRELNNMQSKISILFKNLFNENTQYQLHLKEADKFIEKLCDEIKNIKKQNTILSNAVSELKQIIFECFEIVFKSDFSNISLKKDQKLKLELLQQNYFKICEKTGSCSSDKIMYGDEIPLEKKIFKYDRLEPDEEIIKKEIASISQLNFPTQFFSVENYNESSTKSDLSSNKDESVIMLGKESEKKELKNQLIRENEVLVAQNPNMHCSSDTTQFNKQQQGFFTPEKVSTATRSPVFKDFANQKIVNTPLKVSPLKLVNENFFLKNENVVSPFKRPSSEIDSPPKKNLTTSKHLKRNSSILSPKKSPNSQLKKTNLREAEISKLGVKKLMQTVLNIDCFKKRSSERIFDETKSFSETDDDVIIESPKNFEPNTNDFVRNSKNSDTANKEFQLLTPPLTSGATDLDETYISSSVLKNYNVTRQNFLELIVEDPTVVKEPTREKSPEYDFVPFLHKREPIRKKAERKKLPGHTCPECIKYYKDVFEGDCGSLKKILNKCSRHRDDISPSAEDTPPGYWKPYLTASNVTSPNKSNTTNTTKPE